MAEGNFTSVLETLLRPAAKESAAMPGVLATTLGQARASEEARVKSGLDFLQNYDRGRANLPMAEFGAGMMNSSRPWELGSVIAGGVGAASGAIRSDRKEEMDRFGKIQELQATKATLLRQQVIDQQATIDARLEAAKIAGSVEGQIADSRYLDSISGAAATPRPVNSLAGAPPVAAPAAPPRPVGASVMPPAPMDMTSGPTAPQPAPIIESGAPTPVAPAPSPRQSGESVAAPASPVAQVQPLEHSGYEVEPQAARDFDRAQRTIAIAAANPRSARAQADAAAAKDVLGQLAKTGFAWDSQAQRVRPIGEKDPAYIRDADAAKLSDTQKNLAQFNADGLARDPNFVPADEAQYKAIIAGREAAARDEMTRTELQKNLEQANADRKARDPKAKPMNAAEFQGEIARQEAAGKDEFDRWYADYSGRAMDEGNVPMPRDKARLEYESKKTLAGDVATQVWREGVANGTIKVPLETYKAGLARASSNAPSQTAGAIVKKFEGDAPYAQMAANAVGETAKTLDLINREGIETGAFAPERVLTAKTLGLIGIPVPDSVKNAEQLPGLMVDAVAANIKKINPVGVVSDSDLKFAASVSATDIRQEEKSLRRLMRIQMQVQRATAEQHNAKLEEVYGPDGATPDAAALATFRVNLAPAMQARIPTEAEDDPKVARAAYKERMAAQVRADTVAAAKAELARRRGAGGLQ